MAVVHKDRGSFDVWPSLRASTQALLIGGPLEDAAESLLNNWAVSHTKRGISEAKELARAKDPEQVPMVLRAVLVEEGVGE
eukprot:9116199-Pyramimonas_sp.AAC.1